MTTPATTATKAEVFAWLRDEEELDTKVLKKMNDLTGKNLHALSVANFVSVGLTELKAEAMFKELSAQAQAEGEEDEEDEEEDEGREEDEAAAASSLAPRFALKRKREGGDESLDYPFPDDPQQDVIVLTIERWRRGAGWMALPIAYSPVEPMMMRIPKGGRLHDLLGDYLEREEGQVGGQLKVRQHKDVYNQGYQYNFHEAATKALRKERVDSRFRIETLTIEHATGIERANEMLKYAQDNFSPGSEEGGVDKDFLKEYFKHDDPADKLTKGKFVTELDDDGKATFLKKFKKDGKAAKAAKLDETANHWHTIWKKMTVKGLAGGAPKTDPKKHCGVWPVRYDGAIIGFIVVVQTMLSGGGVVATLNQKKFDDDIKKHEKNGLYGIAMSWTKSPVLELDVDEDDEDAVNALECKGAISTAVKEMTQILTDNGFLVIATIHPEHDKSKSVACNAGFNLIQNADGSRVKAEGEAKPSTKAAKKTYDLYLAVPDIMQYTLYPIRKATAPKRANIPSMARAVK